MKIRAFLAALTCVVLWTAGAQADNAGGLTWDATQSHPLTSIGGRLQQEVWATDARFAGGAPFDGTTDDQPALQAAVTYACGLTNGAIIRAPARAGVLHSTLTISCSNVRIVFGNGVHAQVFDTSNTIDTPFGGASLKWTGPAGGTMVKIVATDGAGGTPILNSVIQGVILDAQSSAATCLLIKGVQGPGVDRMSDVGCVNVADIATVTASANALPGANTVQVGSITGLAVGQYLYHAPANGLPGLTEGARITAITGAGAPYTLTLRGYAVQVATVVVACGGVGGSCTAGETVSITDGATTVSYTVQGGDTAHTIANQLSVALNASSLYPNDWAGVSDREYVTLYSNVAHTAAWNVTNGATTTLTLTTTKGVTSGDNLIATGAGVWFDVADIPNNSTQAGGYSVDSASPSSHAPDVAFDSMYGVQTHGGTGNTNRLVFSQLGVLRGSNTGVLCGDADHLNIWEMHARNNQQLVYSTFAAIGAVTNVSNGCRHHLFGHVVGSRPWRYYGTETGFSAVGVNNRTVYFDTTNQGWMVEDPSTIWSNVTEDDVSNRTGGSYTRSSFVTPHIVADTVSHMQTCQGTTASGVVDFCGTSIRIWNDNLTQQWWISSSHTNNNDLLFGYGTSGGGGGAINLGNGASSSAFTLGEIGHGLRPTNTGTAMGGIDEWACRASDPVANPAAGNYLTYCNSSSGTMRWKDASGNFWNFAGASLAETSNYAVLASDNGRTFSNVGATGEVDFTLPAAANGLAYCFGVDAAQTFKIINHTGDKIYVGGTATAASGNVVASAIGATLCIRANTTGQWLTTSTADPAQWTKN